MASAPRAAALAFTTADQDRDVASWGTSPSVPSRASESIQRDGKSELKKYRGFYCTQRAALSYTWWLWVSPILWAPIRHTMSRRSAQPRASPASTPRCCSARGRTASAPNARCCFVSAEPRACARTRSSKRRCPPLAENSAQEVELLACGFPLQLTRMRAPRAAASETLAAPAAAPAPLCWRARGGTVSSEDASIIRLDMEQAAWNGACW